jgi:hypothetical protein
MKKKFKVDQRQSHCKKKLAIFVFPSRDVTASSLWRGIIELFPPRESLGSGIPVVDGNIDNFFHSVHVICPKFTLVFEVKVDLIPGLYRQLINHRVAS